MTQPASSICPLCGLANCPSLLKNGMPCGPPVERRSGPQDRRSAERRFFPRPEGRRHNLGRRAYDPRG
ncbi:MAG: hypothetical protein NZX77_20410 [Polyangiaceae bacterium]|nr:hypothetical protein [Polyangiaceae bacterium]